MKERQRLYTEEIFAAALEINDPIRRRAHLDRPATGSAESTTS